MSEVAKLSLRRLITICDLSTSLRILALTCRGVQVGSGRFTDHFIGGLDCYLSFVERGARPDSSRSH